jgi:DNA-binding transcriptional regulator LsrR (DeoR family)
MSQKQIADQLNMSRSIVSMMLKLCEERGIVEINIKTVDSRALDIADSIVGCYRIKDVLIASSYHDTDATRGSVGTLAADYLEKHLKTDMKFGFSPGKMNLTIAQHLNFSSFVKADVVTLAGSLSNKHSQFDNNKCLQGYQQKMNGEAYNMTAPMMLRSKELKQLMLQEPLILRTFEQMRALDIALLNIDNVRFPHRMAMHDGQLSSADILQLIELKAVSVICGRYFDIDGDPCNAGINERIMAMDINELKNVPLRIGVAIGTERANAVKSILNSGIINALIIDESLARCL